ncbi:Transcription factor spt8 [Tieghemiomyces parasiticus]|uniref:Transcription factor spt8 n=1 Tax=Tieghemiomyces parasiticus TaxID=78921 RepID=A0A9W7ZSB9_9FUNG|nr:Transcription factor spt8 [Tieghemiomyces parasiticus]
MSSGPPTTDTASPMPPSAGVSAAVMGTMDTLSTSPARPTPAATTTANPPARVGLQRTLPKVVVTSEQIPGEGEVTVLNRPARPAQPIYRKLVAAIHPNSLYSIAATPCMRWVLTGSEDGYIRKWDFFASMNGKNPLTASQRHMQIDTITKGGIMSSYWENDDTPDPFPETGRGTVKNPHYSRSLSPVYSLGVHSDAVWAVSGQEKYIALWGLRYDEGRKVHVFKEHTQPVSTLTVSPDEYGMVSGSWDKRVLYWDLNSGKIAREFKGHTSQISSVSFRPYYRTKDLDATDEAETAVEPADMPVPNPILMTASVDGQCKLWDLRDPTSIPQTLNPQGKTPPWCTSSIWSPDGSKIYVGRRNCTVDEWDFRAAKLIRSLKLPNNSGAVSSLACTANNKQLIW